MNKKVIRVEPEKRKSYWDYDFNESGDVECMNCHSVFPVLTECGVGQSKPQNWDYCPSCGAMMLETNRYE